MMNCQRKTDLHYWRCRSVFEKLIITTSKGVRSYTSIISHEAVTVKISVFPDHLLYSVKEPVLSEGRHFVLQVAVLSEADHN